MQVLAVVNRDLGLMHSANQNYLEIPELLWGCCLASSDHSRRSRSSVSHSLVLCRCLRKLGALQRALTLYIQATEPSPSPVWSVKPRSYVAHPGVGTCIQSVEQLPGQSKQLRHRLDQTRLEYFSWNNNPSCCVASRTLAVAQRGDG